MLVPQVLKPLTMLQSLSVDLSEATGFEGGRVIVALPRLQHLSVVCIKFCLGRAPLLDRRAPLRLGCFAMTCRHIYRNPCCTNKNSWLGVFPCLRCRVLQRCNKPRLTVFLKSCSHALAG